MEGESKERKLANEEEATSDANLSISKILCGALRGMGMAFNIAGSEKVGILKEYNSKEATDCGSIGFTILPREFLSNALIQTLSSIFALILN
jgi:hypothetical protein